MEAVVRGTKTIEEFKRVREDMLKRAERYSRKHIASCENWQEGFPVKCWRGALGVLWIEYESGHCWQYRENGVSVGQKVKIRETGFLPGIYTASTV